MVKEPLFKFMTQEEFDGLPSHIKRERISQAVDEIDRTVTSASKSVPVLMCMNLFLSAVVICFNESGLSWEDYERFMENTMKIHKEMWASWGGGL